MSNCIEKLAHKTDNCSTSDGLQVFQDDEGAFNGYCFACSTYIPNPYGDSEGPDNETLARVERDRPSFEEISAEVRGLPILGMPDRNLRQASLAYFRIRTGLSEYDGETPAYQYYPYTKDGELVCYKVRFLPEKKFWKHGDGRNLDPFGWYQAIRSGARVLYITEGELDAVALYQALRDKQVGTVWEDDPPAVISLPDGASSVGKCLSRFLKEIKSRFQDVVIVYDNDDAGALAIKETVKVLPSVLVARSPCKDPCETVAEGRSRALADAVLFRKSVPTTTRLVSIEDLFDQAATPPVAGVDWPWPKMTQLTRGIRGGETYYIGAGVKMGKSEVVNALAAWLIKQFGWKIFLAKPEEANVKTVRMLAGKVEGKFFHDPNRPFDEEAYRRACAVLRGQVRLLDVYQHMGWGTLRPNTMQAISEGCKAIFIDPITNLTNGINAADANTQLQDISQELSAIALDNDIAAFIFCHLKAPEAGPPHEKGGEVMSHQFAGSRAMMRSCNYMLGLEGNKSRELDIEQRNMRFLKINEDREFGETDGVNLYWDKNTGLFHQVDKEGKKK